MSNFNTTTDNILGSLVELPQNFVIQASYEFNDNSSTLAIDSSGAGRNISNSGGSIQSTIKRPTKNFAAYAPGNTDGTNNGRWQGPIADWNTFVGSFAVEAWVYLPSDKVTFNPNYGVTGNFFVGTGGPSSGGPAFGTKTVNGNPYLAFESGNGPLLTDPNIFPTNQWVHVAAVYDNSITTTKLYLNSVEVASSNSIVWAKGGWPSVFTIGAREYNWVWAQSWNGYISDLRMFRTGFVLNGQLTNLNEQGTGFWNETYYVNGQATNLDSSGNGFWDGYAYSNGAEQPTGWNGYFYYVGNGETTLDQNGNGIIDGKQYINGYIANGWDWNGWTGYYIDGIITTLNIDGFGTWEGNFYVYGQINNSFTGFDWSGWVYYINSQATTLDYNGDGEWNGGTYVGGVLQGGGGGSVNLASGLQAFYKLSDTSDSSGNNRTLTNNGNVSFASGKLGNAAVFDGTNSLTFDLPEMTDLSCSFWVKFNSINSDISLLGKLSNDFFGAYYDAAGQRIVFSRHGIGEMIATQFVPQIGEWYFVSVTRSGSSFKLNINGSSSNNDSGDSASFNSGTYAISVNPNDTYASGQVLDGQIDAVGIWNRALSDAEVAALYNSGNGLELEVTLETGLQAFYKLSDTSDSSGNNRTLTNNGNVSFASGKLGNAAVFDGVNSYLSLPSDPVLDFGSSDFSASFWVNCLPQNAPYPAIISPVNGFYNNTLKICIIVGTENVIGYEHNGSLNLQSTFSLSNNTWYHVVVKRSNGTSYLYINGSLDSSVYDPNNINLGDGGTVIGGGNWDSSSSLFTGSLDAVGIWNRALSDSEISALYNNGTGLEIQATLETGLQAFYKLSDTSDSSGNNRTLTNNGNVSFASGKLGNAAVFDSINYLQGPSGILPTSSNSNYAVSLWVKFASVSTQDAIMLISPVGIGGFCLFYGVNWYGSPNTLTVSQYGVSDTRFDWIPIENTWYHVVINKVADNITVLIDGTSIGTNNYNPSFDDKDLAIGGVWEPQAYPFSPGLNGSIDAVGIWNRALSETEVAELYNNGTGLELPAPTGPVIKNGWIDNIFWINDVTTTLDQNGDGTWVGKLYENGSLFSGSKYSLTFVDGVAQAEQIVTVIGSNIPVAFGLNEVEEPLVELVFASITSAGETTVEQIIPTVLPTGYTVAETVLAYSIDTTATFEGSINVDFVLPSNISQAVFDRVKGFHVKNSGAIEEMTRVSSDFSTKRITVAITSFSDFLFLDQPATGKLVKIQGNVKFYGNVKFAG